MDAPAHYAFYSWQSDLPSKFNRSFVEESIALALQQVNAEVKVESAPRPEMILEKDTKGIPGSPAITDTIVRKIKGAAVFIGDLSFVGQSLPEIVKDGNTPRYFPNPNVMMEYTHALDFLGDERIVAVVNESFGQWLEPSIPFNIRHRRRPILYSYGPSTDPGKKKEIQKRLIADLVGAIGLIRRRPTVHASQAPFSGTNFSPSSFNDMAERGDLIIDGPLGDVKCRIPQQCVLTLRLQPTIAVEEFETQFDALAALQHGHLSPMASELSGISTARNASGAISYQAPRDGQLVFLTQLFPKKELYGIDAASAGVTPPVFHIDRVEQSFASTLKNYFGFARDTLKLPQPWRVSMAVFGIHNRAVTGKRCLSHEFHWSAVTGEAPVLDILRPGFERLSKEFGERRSPQADNRLLQNLS